MRKKVVAKSRCQAFHDKNHISVTNYLIECRLAYTFLMLYKDVTVQPLRYILTSPTIGAIASRCTRFSNRAFGRYKASKSYTGVMNTSSKR